MSGRDAEIANQLSALASRPSLVIVADHRADEPASELSAFAKPPSLAPA